MTPLEARALVAFHDGTQEPAAASALWRAIEDNHRCNRLLWDEEDLARRRHAPDAVIAGNKRAIDRYNQQRVPARARVDLGGGPCLWRRTVDLTLECRNAFDARGQDFAGYPLPGRSWALNARFHFFDHRMQQP